MINTRTSIGTGKEGSTFFITCTFTDEDDVLVTPTSIMWTLTDKEENIVNAREQVSVSPLDSEIDIILSGDDLLAQSTENKYQEYLDRYIIIEAEYDGATGTYPIRDSAWFQVQNLRYVS